MKQEVKVFVSYGRQTSVGVIRGKFAGGVTDKQARLKLENVKLRFKFSR